MLRCVQTCWKGIFFFFFFGKYDLVKFIIRRIDEREIYHYRDQDLLILEWIDILDCNASNILK